MENLNSLLKNNKVYYIYDLRGEVFSISNIWNYLIIIADDYQLEEINKNIKIYKISEWFKLIEKGEILPWICTCLNKKYILKEYVKLLMTVNLLQLRKNYNQAKKSLSNTSSYIELYARLKFTNQIIDNHKIKNFNLSKEINILLNAKDIKETFSFLAFKEEQYLYKYTNGIFLKDKIKCKQF